MSYEVKYLAYSSAYQGELARASWSTDQGGTDVLDVERPGVGSFLVDSRRRLHESADASGPANSYPNSPPDHCDHGHRFLRSSSASGASHLPQATREAYYDQEESQTADWHHGVANSSIELSRAVGQCCIWKLWKRGRKDSRRQEMCVCGVSSHFSSKAVAEVRGLVHQAPLEVKHRRGVLFYYPLQVGWSGVLVGWCGRAGTARSAAGV